MADMDNPHGVVRAGKSDKDGITLSGEQYEQLPESNQIEDRRADPVPTVEANTARTMASMRTRGAVKGRQRAP